MGFRDLFRLSPRVDNSTLTTNDNVEDAERGLREFDAIKNLGDGEVGAFSLPTGINGVGHHISNHPKFQDFPYVNVTDGTKENITDVLNRLHSAMPPIEKNNLATAQFPPIDLVAKTETILVQDLLVSEGRKRQPIKIKKPYVLLSEVIVNFVPLGPINHKFSQFICCLHDDRMVEDTVVNAFVANTNTSSACRFGLDYCVPSSCVQHFKLSFTCNYKPVMDGFAWATISICVTAAELKRPVQRSVPRVHGVLQLPDSALRRHKTNPKVASVAFKNADMEELKNMYERGEIKDIQKPNMSKYTKTIAGTEIGYPDQGNSINGEDQQRSLNRPQEQDPILQRFLRGELPSGTVQQDRSDIDSTQGFLNDKEPQDNLTAFLEDDEDQAEELVDSYPNDGPSSGFTPLNVNRLKQPKGILKPARQNGQGGSKSERKGKKGKHRNNRPVAVFEGDYETYAY